MNTTWSIISGGRLKRDRIAGNASFRITAADGFEPIFLKDPIIKQSFEDRLRQRLCPGGLSAVSGNPLCIEYQSSVVLWESARRNVELSVTVTDGERGGMLWYFMLTSPEEQISPDRLDEIVALVADRLLGHTPGAVHKGCP